MSKSFFYALAKLCVVSMTSTTDKMPSDFVQFMCGSTRVILKRLWLIILHQPIHEEYAPWLCGTQEICYDEFHGEMLLKLCRHRHSHDPMPLMDCNSHDLMIMPLEGGWLYELQPSILCLLPHDVNNCM